jgi:hypothetical protein
MAVRLSKALPVIVSGDLQGCETSRLLHFLDNQLTDAVRLSKALPVIVSGGLQGSETSRLLHFLDNQLTDGGEVK